MAEKKYFWIKLKTDFYDDDEEYDEEFDDSWL